MQIDQHLSKPRLAGPADDPWALTLGERWRLAESLAGSQEVWLRRLRRLVEPPLPDGEFPAFLLELAPFSRLRREIGTAEQPRQLSTAAADELQRFVDRYRTYLIARGGAIES